MNQRAQEVLNALLKVGTLMPNVRDGVWASDGNDTMAIDVVPKKHATVHIRDSRLGYTSKGIGYLATQVEFDWVKDKWEADPTTFQVLWPHTDPSPNEIMRWTQDHTLPLLRDIVETTYTDIPIRVVIPGQYNAEGAEETDLGSDSIYVLRSLIGYRYQRWYFDRYPDRYEQMAARPYNETVTADWDRRLAVLAVQALERGWPESRTKKQADKGVMTTHRRFELRLAGRLPMMPANNEHMIKENAVGDETATATETKKSIIKKKTPEQAKTGQASVKSGKVKKAPKPKAPRASKNGSPDEYTQAKLVAQKKLKVGESVTYTGPNKKFHGKKVKVDRFESRGGVFVKLGDAELVCSPYALGVPNPDRKDGKKAGKE